MFKYLDYIPTLKYAKNPTIQKQIYIDNENKCNQNIPLFKDAILLRDEAARLLSYPNHAAFMIKDKMVKITKTVDDFPKDLQQCLTMGGSEEIKSLGKEDQIDSHYFLWDHNYYN